VEEKLFEKFDNTNDSKYLEFYEIYNYFRKGKFWLFVLLSCTTIFFVVIREYLFGSGTLE